MSGRIFLYRADTDIPSAQLEALRRNGFIPVKVKHLSDVSVMAMPAPIPQGSLDLMLDAAAATFVQFSSTSDVAGTFGIELSKRLLALKSADAEPLS